MNHGLVVGVDASRNRSGGAKANLAGILANGDPAQHGIRQVHLWAFRSLLDSIESRPWLIKHNPKELEKSLSTQLWWQAIRLAAQAKALGCHVLFTTDASTLCRFKPMVVMSQDLSSYEHGVMRSYGFGQARLRLHGILWVQNRAFRSADGVIFLTRYASRLIQQSCGPLSRVACIPHGIGAAFRNTDWACDWPSAGEHEIRCLYVSNTLMYKNHWVVVRAIAALRNRGHNVTLSLAGGGSGRAQEMLEEQVKASDPHGDFVRQLGHVSQGDLPGLLANASLFVFASSCENMPVTLLEAMAVGLPIACSNRGPMPEVLADGGVYFDPEDADSISNAVERIITDRPLRSKLARRAKELSDQYSWSRCAHETWSFIGGTCETIRRED